MERRPSDAKAQAAPVQATHSVRVLLAEDDDGLRNGLAQLLVVDGYDVSMAKSGAQMLDYLAGWLLEDGSTPPFEIIVAQRFNPATLAIGGFGNFHGLARLRPGVTLAEAGMAFQRMLPIWLGAWPMQQGSSVTREALENWRITPVVAPLKDDMVGDIARALWVLMGAIGAVLLVACANIANLMLVRADARRPELAVRAALGAVPARIARELLVESLVIGAIGGAIGLVLAYGGLEVLAAVGPSNLPRLEEIAVHPPVLAFTVVAALVSTVAFGSITALRHALGSDTLAFGGVRGGSASHERSATRNVLVVVQLALALVLVVSTVLMI